MIKNRVYQIYHSKAAILYEVSKKYVANIYFFNDISTFHFKILEYDKLYPNPYFINHIFRNVNTPIFFNVKKYRYSLYYIQGGCFGGTKSAIKYLYKNYYNYLFNYYKIRKDIIITEEHLLNIIINRMNDSVIMPNNPNNCSFYTDETKWFYYINILSGKPEKCVYKLKLKYLNDYINPIHISKNRSLTKSDLFIK